MTLVHTVTSLGERFLRERTFELIVAPAIADLQHADHAARGLGLREASLLTLALAWGFYEDVASDPGQLLTFVGLALIPAGYYALLIMICAPVAGHVLPMPGARVAVGVAIFVLSMGPALACYWPERPARRTSLEA